MTYNKCHNTYHSTITMNPIDVKWSKYINFGVKNNEKDPKFKISDHSRKLKYNVFA